MTGQLLTAGADPPLLRDLVRLPWRHYVTKSPQEPANIVTAIRNMTAPRRHFWEAPNSSFAFEGIVDRDTFTLSRVISYRNSFLPVITGQISPLPTGSQVVIWMRLRWFTLLFWIAWMSAVTSGLALFSFVPHGTQNGSLGITVPLGMFLFGYFLCSASFGFEARRASRIIQDLIK